MEGKQTIEMRGPIHIKENLDIVPFQMFTSRQLSVLQQMPLL